MFFYGTQCIPATVNIYAGIPSATRTQLSLQTQSCVQPLLSFDLNISNIKFSHWDKKWALQVKKRFLYQLQVT